MNTLKLFLTLVTELLREFGPILVAINAIWSLCSKVRSLFKARKSSLGEN